MLRSRRHFLKALAGALAVLPFSGMAQSLAAPRTTSFGLTGRIITPDPETGKLLVLDQGLLLVNGGRVEAVLSHPETAVTDRPVTDLGKATILPGLINSHVHPRLSPSGLRERFLAHGITGLGVPGLPLSDMARALKHDSGPLPDMAVAGPVVTVPGGYPIPAAGPEWAMAATTRREAGECVRRAADKGATMVKIAFEPGTALRPYPVTGMEVAEGAANMGRRLGMVVRCHAEDLSGLQSALAVGVDGVEHLACRWLRNGQPTPVLTKDKTPVPEYLALMKRMVRDGVTLTPTLEVLWEKPWKDALFPALRAYAGMGGKLAMGNDCPFGRAEAGMPMKEIGLLARAGLSAEKILIASTLGSAEVCGMNGSGSLAPGSPATFLVVRGNPLDNLETLRDPLAVFKDGRKMA